MRDVLIGSEALRNGTLTRNDLQRHYVRVLPDVYAPKRRALSLRDRTVAAWLWSRRRATIAGVSAAAMHGAQWVDGDVPIELIWSAGRPPRGLIVRNETLSADEVTTVAGIPVTTVTRTAFDLGRHLPRRAAVARLDSLIRARPFSTSAVHLLAEQHRGVRGLDRLRRAIPLIDAGAASPKETWLRLLIVDAGLPVPRTQIPIHDDYGLVAILDMGWETFKVAAEYDGDQHRSDRRQYVWDQRRSRLVAARGWDTVRVINEDRKADVLARIHAALWARGWRP